MIGKMKAKMILVSIMIAMIAGMVSGGTLWLCEAGVKARSSAETPFFEREKLKKALYILPCAVYNILELKILRKGITQ